MLVKKAADGEWKPTDYPVVLAGQVGIGSLILDEGDSLFTTPVVGP